VQFSDELEEMLQRARERREIAELERQARELMAAECSVDARKPSRN
jgi:hypothetical protein